MAAVRRTKLMEFFWRTHPALYRATGGLIGGRITGNPILLLTTQGRRTGQPRTKALAYLDQGDSCVVIASYAGEPKHPAWWLNLEANPEATVQRGKTVTRMRARQAEGEERERLWAAIVAQESGFAEYQRRTTRHIPVVVLEPIKGG